MATAPSHDRAGADDGHDDFGGLHRDLPRLLGRRRALQILGGVSLAGFVAGCGSDSPGSTGGDTTSSSSGASSRPTTAASTAAASAGEEIPDETQGPFPADGSNGPNALTEDGIVRSDLTTSFGDASGTAEGVPMTLQLTVVDASTGNALPGAAVYLWHCTADGRYSIYEIEDQNYLRGVQETDDAGKLAFTTIFPGCYAGRWPHFHFEVYDGLDRATAGSEAVKTSQIALPESDCDAAYTDSRYGQSTGNLAQLSLTSDMVFSDAWSDQLATVVGTIREGYTASLLVRI